MSNLINFYKVKTKKCCARCKYLHKDPYETKVNFLVNDFPYTCNKLEIGLYMQIELESGEITNWDMKTCYCNFFKLYKNKS